MAILDFGTGEEMTLLPLLLLGLITARKPSCGKVMFLHLSVCSHGGGVAYQHASHVT